MQTHRSSFQLRPSLFLALLLILFVTLWVAGGASRADVLGQVVVRSVTWSLLVIAVIFGQPPRFCSVKLPAIILLASIALPLLQLLPLPPPIWQTLPGHDVLSEAAVASALEQPWRPWSIAPGATLHALGSLVVPAATLIFATRLTERERLLLPTLILGLVGASTLIGLLQFSGIHLNNPLINDRVGAVSGPFANRNHFALFLAFGCMLAPAWPFLGDRRATWRHGVAMGMTLLFTLTILATGSRVGLVLVVLGLSIGIWLARHGIKKSLRRAPRWAFPALIAAIVGAILFFIVISIAADRAQSINRLFALDPAQDMRRRALPTVLAMIGAYFPAGAGFGTFDASFRIHEPFKLLKVTYFNHAHNDFLEIVLDGGLPASLVLITALGWWGYASARVWRAGNDPQHMLSKLGSAMLLLVIIASVFDYPARTPTIMAMTAIAAVWLSQGLGQPARSALPEQNQHL